MFKRLLKEGKYEEALSAAVHQISMEKNPNKIINMGKKLPGVPLDVAIRAGYQVKKIAILGGYTTDYFVHLIRARLLLDGFWGDIFQGDYGTGESALMSEDPALRQFSPDICYLMFGTQHLAHTPSLENEKNRWTAIFHKLKKWLACEIVFNTFVEPLERAFGQYAFKYPGSKTNIVRDLNKYLGDELDLNIHFVDTRYLASYFGYQHWHDQKLYDMAKVPCAFNYWIDYADAFRAVVRAMYGKTKKVLVLDLDNTLWGGVIGDDGVEGIRIGESGDDGECYKRFQAYVLSLKKRGVILAVASKNDKELALEGFRINPNMVLKESDISCFMANWEPKHENIIKISETLHLGLDSFVFVDDNPAERELVKKFLPQVEVIELPNDPAKYIETLDRSLAFDIISLSDDDLNRAQQYSENAKRVAVRQSFGDYNDYLKGLEMTGAYGAFDAVNMKRIVQLINKTNQFNLTSHRYTEEEVLAFQQSDTYLCRYIKLKDKFGDNGLIAVLIAEVRETTVFVDTWLMSCRVLKRGLEAFSLGKLLQEAVKMGAKRVVGRYIASKRNGIVAELYSDFGFNKSRTDGDEQYFDLELRNIESILNSKPFKHVIRQVTIEEYREDLIKS